MDYSLIIVVAVYITGIWIAFFQLQLWCGKRVSKDEECELLFMMSTLSWLIYPLYFIVKLLNKMRN